MQAEFLKSHSIVWIWFTIQKSRSNTVPFRQLERKHCSFSSDVTTNGLFLFRCQLDTTGQLEVVCQVYFMQRFYFLLPPVSVGCTLLLYINMNTEHHFYSHHDLSSCLSLKGKLFEIPTPPNTPHSTNTPAHTYFF